jgi:hypothetical protein
VAERHGLLAGCALPDRLLSIVATACGGIRVGRFGEPGVIAPAGDQLQLTTGRQEDADADRGRQELRLGGAAIAGAAIMPGAPRLVGLVLAAGPALIDPIDPGEVTSWPRTWAESVGPGKAS